MKIQKLLLNSNNEFLIDDETALGTLIKQSGKEHLWSERNSSEVNVVVLHYISAIAVSPRVPFQLNTILKIFCDYGVSSHFLISRDGEVFQLVPEDKKAWHSGGSIMPAPDSRQNVNEFSIGIELMATAESGFTPEQYDAVAELSFYLENLYKRFPAYVGHEHIAGTRAVELGLRKDVKVDPGILFDWQNFRGKLDTLRKGTTYKPVV